MTPVVLVMTMAEHERVVSSAPAASVPGLVHVAPDSLEFLERGRGLELSAGVVFLLIITGYNFCSWPEFN